MDSKRTIPIQFFQNPSTKKCFLFPSPYLAPFCWGWFINHHTQLQEHEPTSGVSCAALWALQSSSFAPCHSKKELCISPVVGPFLGHSLSPKSQGKHGQFPNLAAAISIFGAPWEFERAKKDAKIQLKESPRQFAADISSQSAAFLLSCFFHLLFVPILFQTGGGHSQQHHPQQNIRWNLGSLKMETFLEKTSILTSFFELHFIPKNKNRVTILNKPQSLIYDGKWFLNNIFPKPKFNVLFLRLYAIVNCIIARPITSMRARHGQIRSVAAVGLSQLPTPHTILSQNWHANWN